MTTITRLNRLGVLVFAVTMAGCQLMEPKAPEPEAPPPPPPIEAPLATYEFDIEAENDQVIGT